MARLDRMGIQGIRSFGPDEMRHIQFYSPLTLILGQNGCGKTTIIESLKYIATGDVPPGCGKGGPFVHDPKIAREMSVRGQVKLQFIDTKNKTHVAMRVLEVTQQAKNLKVTTVDTTIQMLRDDAPNIAISSKCADFEAQMGMLLGVSKPILTNVIFCHQEESNWPLDEGKKVKEKFDAIFSATKYIKCLETIKKYRAELKIKVKTMEEILQQLKKWKDEVHLKRSSLMVRREDQEELVKEKENLDQESEPLKKKLREISSLEEDLGTKKGDLLGKQHQLGYLRKAQEDLRAAQAEQLTCSDAELDIMIQNFQENLTQHEQDLRRVEGKIRNVEGEIQSKQKEVLRAQRRQGELEAAHKSHQRDVSRRDALMVDLVAEFGVSELEGNTTFSNPQAEVLISHLATTLDTERGKTRAKKDALSDQEAKIQKEIDELRSQEAALNQQIESSEQRLQDTGRKVKEAKQGLRRTESELSDCSLEDLHRKLEEVDHSITQQEARISIPQFMENIDAERKRKQEVEGQLDEVKRLVARMNRQANARSQYDLHLKEKKDLENKIQVLKRRREDELIQLFDEVPEENIKHKLDACTTNLRSQISSVQRELERLNRSKTQHETAITSNKQRAERKETEIKVMKNKIESTCRGKDLDSALDSAKKQKEDLTRQRGELSSSITVLNRFTDKLKERDCCPLCHRDFTTKDEVLQLIEELQTKVQKIPEKLERVKDNLVEQDQLHDRIIQLRPQRDRANEAQVELDTIRQQIAEDEKALQKVNQDIQDKEMVLANAQGDEEIARDVQTDVVTIENHTRRIRQLKDLVDDLQATLGGSGTEEELSMDEAVTRQTEFEEQLRAAQKKIEELQYQLQEHKDQIQRLKDKKLSLTTQEMQMKTKMQAVEKLKEEVVKLEGERTQLQEELERSQQSVAPYTYRIKNKATEKAAVTREREAWVDTQNKMMNSITEKQRGLGSLQGGITQYVERGGQEQLEESRQQITSLQHSTSQLEASRNALCNQYKKTEKEIINQREKKQNLDNEKKIRDKEVEAEKLERCIKELKNKIQDLDSTSLITEKDRLSRKWTQILKKQGELTGRLEEVKNTIESLEKDLQRKEYREAENNYKDKFIEKKCTSLAVDDMNKYYLALYNAILHFHADRMRTINSIIRQLWRVTYKGNDIDYIEIKTDEAGASVGGADKRQSYNYRVVMVKNDTELDMRGRCSAGQKVLASLIIRMALAETFSSNCSILALDEPTTNLDRENIDALSEALLQIVSARKAQRNMQLIVITHDQDFMEKLTRAEFIDMYWEVSRNERGFSQIKQHQVD